KNYGASVLLTEQTKARLADPSNYLLRHLGRVAVKGKAHGVGLFEAFDADPPLTRDAKIETLTEFNLGVEELGAGRFDQAHAAFAEVLAAHPQDGAAAYLQHRCEVLAGAGEPWDGVDHVATK
ncbi:MAG: hypothetical protein JO349_02400, partial [Candidatus Eremiobacteraeota bacterium]|nr:hypothetical protein [Candidatus Eremiobacteraeota bacterium]